ncbi:MAG: T9SS type A sorting domain-containing protein [Bacteroides sp.]|nr:T9SS type A sorting domain-containing protein [Bacteroides sp.]
MKKLYAIAAMALLSAASISAKEFTFYQGDNKIENGSEFKFGEAELEDWGDGYAGLTYDPHLFLEADFTGSANITANCTSGQFIQLCAGGQCMRDKKVVKTNIPMSPGSKLNLQFEYVNDDYELGTEFPVVVTEISAVDTTDPKVSASFTIVMDGKEAGVSTVIANDNAFLPVEGGVEYSFDAPTQVAIYSLAGEAMIETSLNGNGTLSTANLPAGIYVYKAGAKSGKIYLR